MLRQPACLPDLVRSNPTFVVSRVIYILSSNEHYSISKDFEQHWWDEASSSACWAWRGWPGNASSRAVEQGPACSTLVMALPCCEELGQLPLSMACEENCSCCHLHRTSVLSTTATRYRKFLVRLVGLSHTPANSHSIRAILCSLTRCWMHIVQAQSDTRCHALSRP